MGSPPWSQVAVHQEAQGSSPVWKHLSLSTKCFFKHHRVHQIPDWEGLDRSGQHSTLPFILTLRMKQSHHRAGLRLQQARRKGN